MGTVESVVRLYLHSVHPVADGGYCASDGWPPSGIVGHFAGQSFTLSERQGSTMGKVNQARYGDFRPKLRIEDLDGGNFIILTVAEFGEETLEGAEGKKLTPFLAFEETDKVFWINGTQVGYLIEGMKSDDSDDWRGQKVPIVKKEVEYRGKVFEKLWIAEPSTWAKLMNGTKPVKRGRK